MLIKKKKHVFSILLTVLEKNKNKKKSKSKLVEKIIA